MCYIRNCITYIIIIFLYVVFTVCIKISYAHGYNVYFQDRKILILSEGDYYPLRSPSGVLEKVYLDGDNIFYDSIDNNTIWIRCNSEDISTIDIYKKNWSSKNLVICAKGINEEFKKNSKDIDIKLVYVNNVPVYAVCLKEKCLNITKKIRKV